MMRGTTGAAANAILRQIGALARIDGLDRQKPILIIEDIRSVDWASLTFVGERHEFDLRLEGESGAVTEAMARIEATLGDCEFALAGRFLAEVSVDIGDGLALRDGGAARQFRVDALSIRD